MINRGRVAANDRSSALDPLDFRERWFPPESSPSPSDPRELTPPPRCTRETVGARPGDARRVVPGRRLELSHERVLVSTLGLAFRLVDRAVAHVRGRLCVGGGARTAPLARRGAGYRVFRRFSGRPAGSRARWRAFRVRDPPGRETGPIPETRFGVSAAEVRRGVGPRGALDGRVRVVERVDPLEDSLGGRLRTIAALDSFRKVLLRSLWTFRWVAGQTRLFRCHRPQLPR